MTTQLLIPQRSTMNSMGDENNSNHEQQQQYLQNNQTRSPSLDGSVGASGAAHLASIMGTGLDRSSMMNMPCTGGGSNGSINGMPTAFVVPMDGTKPKAAVAVSKAASLSSPTVSSFAGGGLETGIVSHLRRSSTGTTGSGSPRQDIESKLKAKGSINNNSLHNSQNSVDGFSLNGGIGNFSNNFNNSNTTTNVSNSMVSSSSHFLHAAGVGGDGGLNGNTDGQRLLVQGSNGNNNLAAIQVAIASGNPLAALLLRDQANLEAALSQVASLNNGMIMPNVTTPSPNPNMLLAAHLGNFGGNFLGLTAAAAAAKPGSVLDPRLVGALFNGATVTSSKPRRKPRSLYMDCDTDSLSEYQCLIRQQIELFEADQSEAASSVQGRNKQIVEGQVGIRCVHCSHLPSRQRQKGSMYFPTKLDRIYQAAQNLSTFHLCDNCKHIPDHVRKKILLLRERKSPAGGGKRYWGEGVRCLGVTEDESGLRFC